MKTAVPLGRAEWLDRLSALPFVTLMHAPASTGKLTVAEFVARRAGVRAVDLRMWPTGFLADEYGRPIPFDDDRATPHHFEDPPLSMGMVREVVEWSRRAPLSSPYKVAIVRLSHVPEVSDPWAASEHTCATLLKLLEEPPRTCRFILLACEPVPVMIRSRAQTVLTAGLLPPEVLAEILVKTSGVLPADALRIATACGGRANQAGRVSNLEGSIGAVVSILTSLKARDQVALSERSRIWTDADTEMLLVWCHERLTGRGSVFSGSGAPELSRLAADRILRTVSRVREARPRLVVGAVAALAEK